jgi:hypothetical protein
MTNSVHKPNKSLRRVSLRQVFLQRNMVAATWSLVAVFAIQIPELTHGQTPGYYTQNGGVVWYGAQQQRVHHPATAYNSAPGYVQHHANNQVSLRGTHTAAGYPAAANAAAANRYGGAPALQQPGVSPQTHQRIPVYGAPQQLYGYYQPPPTYRNGWATAYGQHFVDRQRQQYAQPRVYPGHGYSYPVAGSPGYSTPPAEHPAYTQQPPQQEQQPTQQPNLQQNPDDQNQLPTVQQAARQVAANVSPNGVPVLSPAASRFFRNLQGPNLSTYNQNRQNYSFFGQTRPSNRIPNTTWQSGSRFGQTYSNRSNHNQTTAHQNRFNYSLRSLTRPGFLDH